MPLTHRLCFITILYTIYDIQKNNIALKGSKTVGNRTVSPDWVQDLKPIKHGTLSQHVYKNLLHFILAGKIAPGQHLVEQKLADQLAVSRISVREAIRELSKDGLVEIIPNSGAFVITHTVRDIEEIYQLRAALEGIAIERLFDLAAVERLTRLKCLDDLITEMGEMEARQDRLQGAALDTQFHQELMSLSDHRKAIRIWTQMSAQIQVIVYHASQFFPTFEGFVERHQSMISLLKTGSVNACTSYIKKHIMDGGQQLINALKDSQKETI